jgi:ABC-type Fe3+ transport system substrate-binding protein
MKIDPRCTVKTRNPIYSVVWVSLWLGLLQLASGALPEARGQASGKQLLQQLVEGARKEGQLDWYGLDSQGSEGSRALAQAFNKRFGLNLRVNADVSGNIVAVFSKAIVESKTGLPPTYDVIRGPDHRGMELLPSGGLERIDNWEALLKEISPEAYAVREKVSPGPIAGYAFVYLTRLKVMNYNTNLIKEAELPQTQLDLGNPRYKGAFPLSPFVTDAEFGTLVYPRDRWMEIVSTWGALQPPIMTYVSGVQRMILGEFKFMPSNAHQVMQEKAKNPKVPLALGFFKDLNAVSYEFHMVRKGAKHPNAAKLFTLWATTSEANRIVEDPNYSGSPNLLLGTGPTSRQELKALTNRNIKPLSWFDSKESIEKLLWFETEEGKRYVKELSAARLGRK